MQLAMVWRSWGKYSPWQFLEDKDRFYPFPQEAERQGLVLTIFMFQIDCSMFKDGDVIMLKSGGPPMTISEIDHKTNTATCEWFDTDNKPHKAVFNVKTLKAFVPPKEIQWL